jgi:hypothetical protein
VPADPGADVGGDLLRQLEDILAAPRHAKLDAKRDTSSAVARFRSGPDHEADQAEGVEVVDRLLQGLRVHAQGAANLARRMRSPVVQKLKDGESCIAAQEISQWVTLELHGWVSTFKTPEDIDRI